MNPGANTPTLKIADGSFYFRDGRHARYLDRPCPGRRSWATPLEQGLGQYVDTASGSYLYRIVTAFPCPASRARTEARTDDNTPGRHPQEALAHAACHHNPPHGRDWIPAGRADLLGHHEAPHRVFQVSRSTQPHSTSASSIWMHLAALAASSGLQGCQPTATAVCRTG